MQNYVATFATVNRIDKWLTKLDIELFVRYILNFP
jgi:hypothetical protein